jgi:hypothetical protein
MQTEAVHNMANRPVTERKVCKQRPLLGKTRNIHAPNNRTTGLCNPFLSNGSLYTLATIGVLLETVFTLRSMKSGDKEELVVECQMTRAPQRRLRSDGNPSNCVNQLISTSSLY